MPWHKDKRGINKRLEWSGFLVAMLLERYRTCNVLPFKLFYF